MREEFSFVVSGTTITFVRLYSDAWVCSLPDTIAQKLKLRCLDLDKISVSDIGLSVRLSNVLKAAGLMNVYDVVINTESEISKLPNCGARSVKELKNALAEIGLELKK